MAAKLPHSTANAGLWLDKYIWAITEDDKESKPELAKKVCSISIPQAYEDFFDEWKSVLNDLGATTCEAKVCGRMVVGLGADGVLETAVTLHRTYGVPVIPGSALKGLAAHYARNFLNSERWRKTGDEKGKDKLGDAYKTMFGETDDAGYVTFFDALYVPGTGHGSKPLHPDVMTPHHPDYYGDKGKPPADWDNPTPVPFVSATGTYLIAVAGEEKWVETAFRILERALVKLGVGAKTSSGYGRLTLSPDRKKPTVKTDPEQAAADALIEKVTALRPTDVPGQIGPLAQKLSSFKSAAQRKRVAQAIQEKVKFANWKGAKDKAWYPEVQKNL